MRQILLTALLFTSLSAPAAAGRVVPAVSALPAPADLLRAELAPPAHADPRAAQIDEAVALMEVSRFLRSLPQESQPLPPERIDALDDRASSLLSGLLTSELADWQLRVEGARCEGTESAPELAEAALAVEQAELLLERGEVTMAPDMLALLDWMTPPVEALAARCTRS